jgi:hypothetical protein
MDGQIPGDCADHNSFRDAVRACHRAMRIDRRVSAFFRCHNPKGSWSPFRLRRRIALTKDGRSTAKTERGGPFCRAREELTMERDSRRDRWRIA